MIWTWLWILNEILDSSFNKWTKKEMTSKVTHLLEGLSLYSWWNSKLDLFCFFKLTRTPEKIMGIGQQLVQGTDP
jgi:hypothetical protein